MATHESMDDFTVPIKPKETEAFRTRAREIEQILVDNTGHLLRIKFQSMTGNRIVECESACDNCSIEGMFQGMPRLVVKRSTSIFTFIDITSVLEVVPVANFDIGVV